MSNELVIQWELFADEPNVDEVALKIETYFQTTAKQQIESYKNGDDTVPNLDALEDSIFSGVAYFMEQFADLGASDTEPREALFVRVQDIIQDIEKRCVSFQGKLYYLA